MKQNLLLLFALCSICRAHAQESNGLIINEIMQSNVECIMDDLKEFPDSWVELFNASDQTVNLQNYRISSKKNADNAWQLPNQEVEPKGYVIVFCDKEEKGLHTDFRLESGKNCNLYLFKGGKVVDKLEGLAKMPAPDVAYGRKTDGADEWGYQLTPSAGKANTGEICDGGHILGAPVFSEPGRVTSGKSTISLELSLPEDAPEGAVIRYTTNGEEPTAASTQYTKAIDIKKTTVIRAKLFCEGWLSPLSTAQSYIFHPRKMTIPVFSVQTKDDYLNGHDIGLFYNNKSKEDKKTHDWRRPVNIEFFPAEDKESAFNQPGETRIQGGQSRSNDLKSMVFYANKRFDPENKQFQYDFFPDQKPGIKKFKSFSLRDGGNDFGDLYFRDAIIQRTMASHVDLDWQACHSAVLYINGEYMGMLNIRERSNEDNIYSNYDGLEDVDEIEIAHEKVNNVDQFIEELKEGDDKFYKAFKEFYSQKGHTLAEYEEWMDVSEYLNIMVMNLFYGNIDFPGNNIVFWRPNDDAKDCPLPKRWRFIVKDADFGLGLYGRKPDYNTIDLLYNSSKYPNDNWAFSEPATRLVKNMLEDPEIFNMFIDKCCIFMGDFMNAEGTGAIIDAIQKEAMEEFVAHRNKYNPNPWGNNRDDINNKFNDAKKWLAGYTESGWWGQSTTYLPRTDYFLKFLKDQFHLGEAIPVAVSKDAQHKPVIIMNGIELSKDTFEGKLFANQQLTLAAIAPENMVVKGWKVVTSSTTGKKTTQEYEGSELSLTIPTCKSLSVEAILGDAAGIDKVTATHQWKWQRTEEGICVSSVPAGQKVSLYDLRGELKSEAISDGGDLTLPAAGEFYLLKVGNEAVKIK